MLSSSVPTLVPTPFASGAGAGFINPIPIPSQIVGGSDPGLASMTTGFPPRTFTPEGSGGLPPRGQDFNGILNLHSTAIQWAQLGKGYVYNAAFQTAIGGYPKGAVLARSDLSGGWISTAENNLTNPETLGAGWLPYQSAAGLLNITVGGSSITLTALQAATGVIRLNGTLSANINLIFPNWPGFQWTIINNYGRNNFRVTAKMASGATVLLSPIGASTVYCNGTDVINNAQQVGVASDVGQAVQLGQFTSLRAQSGWMMRPDGMLEQWGRVNVAGQATTVFTFPIPFPTVGLNILVSKGSSIAANGEFAVGADITSVSQFTITNSSSLTAAQGIFWRALGY